MTFVLMPAGGKVEIMVPHTPLAEGHAAVNEILPAKAMFLLALQHVLTMYSGALAVPLVLGAAVGLTREQIAFLISADLLS